MSIREPFLLQFSDSLDQPVVIDHLIVSLHGPDQLVLTRKTAGPVQRHVAVVFRTFNVNDNTFDQQADDPPTASAREQGQAGAARANRVIP
jgi:hypothetical protein